MSDVLAVGVMRVPSPTAYLSVCPCVLVGVFGYRTGLCKGWVTDIQFWVIAH